MNNHILLWLIASLEIVYLVECPMYVIGNLNTQQNSMDNTIPVFLLFFLIYEPGAKFSWELKSSDIIIATLNVALLLCCDFSNW